jgi:hypothetical protein
MFTITKEWLKEKSACKDGYEWSIKKIMPCDKFIKALIKDEEYHWGSWVLVRVFNKEENVKYAIFAAEQVIDIYEKKYPTDKRPRKAIEAAKKWVNEPNEINRAAAAADAAAADAAYAAAADAADAADAAYAAAADAADAAYAAAAYAYAADAYAAYAYAAAAYAADAAYSADADAADAADAAYAAAADAARKEIRIKILNYGIKLLRERGLK